MLKFCYLGKMRLQESNIYKKALKWNRHQFSSILVGRDATAQMLCVMCTAALHSQLGTKTDRLNEQEIKEACTHFQCAAGVLVYLYVR